MRKITIMNHLNKEERLQLHKYGLDQERPVEFVEGKKLSDILYYRNDIHHDGFGILGRHVEHTAIMITNVLIGHALLDQFDGSDVLFCICRFHFKDGSLGEAVEGGYNAWVPAHWLRYRQTHRSLVGRLPPSKKSHEPL